MEGSIRLTAKKLEQGLDGPRDPSQLPEHRAFSGGYMKPSSTPTQRERPGAATTTNRGCRSHHRKGAN